MRIRFSHIDLHLGASRKEKPLFRFLAAPGTRFLDFLYPPVCLVCGSRLPAHDWLCKNCDTSLRNSQELKHQSGPGDFIYLPAPFHFNQIITFWPYSPEIETLVHHVKYHKGWRLGIRLGKEIGRVLPGSMIDNFDYLIPVPLHYSRLRERGYNQSLLYCKGFQRIHSIPILRNHLIRFRSTTTQTQLDADARQMNVNGAFRVKNPNRIRDKCIMLFDDLVTTGATVNSCAGTLIQAGARSVTGMALVRPDVRCRAAEIP